MSTCVDLLNLVKKEIRNGESGQQVLIQLKPIKPKYFKCQKSQLIIDSFTRIVNDENVNIVTSSQFLVQINKKSDYLDKIEIIHLSANKIDQDFIERSKKIIRTTMQFQLNSKLHEEPNNYIFEYYSAKSIKNIIENVGKILNLIGIIGFSDIEYTKHDLNCSNISKMIRKYENLCRKTFKIPSALNFLNLSLGFIFETFYQNEWRFNKSKNDSQELSKYLLFFFHCIWDAYSFFVLSKDFFILNKSCKIIFNQIIEDSDNQYEVQVKKFKY
jgi:hypothetical protein